MSNNTAPDLRAAAQQALEALEHARDCIGPSEPKPAALCDVEAAIAALSAALAAAPAGWRLVPCDPTPEMLACLVDGKPGTWGEGKSAEFYGTRELMEEHYRSMLAAAPAAPAAGEQKA
jgi:hypothetical protein